MKKYQSNGYVHNKDPIKRRNRSKFSTIIGTAMALGALLYFGACVTKSLGIEKKVEPLKSKFEYAAKNNSHSIERIQGLLDDAKVLDYCGALDKIVAERDSVCKANKSIYCGTWTAGDYGISTSGVPFVYNPF